MSNVLTGMIKIVSVISQLLFKNFQGFSSKSLYLILFLISTPTLTKQLLKTLKISFFHLQLEYHY